MRTEKLSGVISSLCSESVLLHGKGGTTPSLNGGTQNRSGIVTCVSGIVTCVSGIVTCVSGIVV